MGLKLKLIFFYYPNIFKRGVTMENRDQAKVKEISEVKMEGTQVNEKKLSKKAIKKLLKKQNWEKKKEAIKVLKKQKKLQKNIEKKKNEKEGQKSNPIKEKIN